MNTEKPIGIAIADDHTLFRNGIKDFLSTNSEFIFLHEACNGEEIINYLTNTSVLPDVCILDIRMPEKNGIETCKEIVENWPEIKVLGFSVADNEHSIIQMLKAGAHGFLSKAAEPSELKEAILTMYTDGEYFDSEILSIVKNSEFHLIDEITEREKEFILLCCTDHNYKCIAKEMGISIRTVETYRDAVYRKINVNNRIALVLFALRAGLI